MAAEASPPLIAIDGPSGVGKGTVARRVAARLGLPYFDTGAMYRSVALETLRRGVPPDDREAVERLSGEIDLVLDTGSGDGFDLLLDGRPVGDAIRTPEVSAATSKVAAHPGVRRRMVELQRRWGAEHGGVMEGRDIGSVVFPDTPYKIFLDARTEVRAERRFKELRERGRETTFEEVLADQEERDRRDSSRADSPLLCDESYSRVDTSELSIEEVVERVLAELGPASSSRPSP